MEQLQPLDPTEQAVQVRMAEMQAYAMKPEMDIIAADRAAAPKTPEHFVHKVSTGESHLVGGEPILTTEQKQQHWSLQGQAEHNARNVERLDAAAHDISRDVIERRVAQSAVAALTNPQRNVERPR
jgi:hypothetical protein